MVQILTPWSDPEPGNGPPVRRFLSNYFDLLFHYLFTNALVVKSLQMSLSSCVTEFCERVSSSKLCCKCRIKSM